MDRRFAPEESRDPEATRRLGRASSEGPLPAPEGEETVRLERESHASSGRPPPPDAPGRGAAEGAGRLVLDRYRLEGRLGAGGFGVVWRARDERLERDVAVKEIRHQGPAPGRAEREARAAARLNHPGIVALYELGADEHAFYLVSELVHGRSLAELLDAGALSDRDVARVGAALCDALAHAHAREVVHRDVKPQNVMVVAEPATGSGFAKLTDFGASTLGTSDGLTRPGDVIGTLAYMSPEQAEGLPVDEAADVYSLALTLYEGFSGENPVLGTGLADTARRVGRPIPALERVRRDLPLDLCRALDAALQPDPARRGTLKQLSRALVDGERDLSGAGGLDEAETLERVGLAHPPRRRLMPDREPPDPGEPVAGGRRPSLGPRVLAGAAAAVLFLVGAEALGPTATPAPPLLAAAVAGVAVALLPRTAWLAAAAVLVAWLTLPPGARDGTALVLVPAAISVVVLLPRAGALWSVPAVAPALGAVALASGFPALAGLARGPLRRAGLAAAGYVWVLLAELLTGRTLLLGPVEGERAAGAWRSSILGALEDGLWPLVSSPVALGLIVWAAFAVLLPLAVRGRSPVADLLGAVLWCGALVAAHLALAEQLAPWLASGSLPSPVGGVILGAFAAAVAQRVARRMDFG